MLDEILPWTNPVPVADIKCHTRKLFTWNVPMTIGWLIKCVTLRCVYFFSNSHGQLFLSFSFFFFFFLERDPWNGPSTIFRYTRCENILLEDGGMKVRDDSSIRSMRCNRKSSLRIKFRISECTWCTCMHSNVKQSCLLDSTWLLDARSGFSLSFKLYRIVHFTLIIRDSIEKLAEKRHL